MHDESFFVSPKYGIFFSSAFSEDNYFRKFKTGESHNQKEEPLLD